ncbi:MAG: hypothetical protein FIB06_04575 [Betaproteobacteria bacterium]|nr:hypothetical protein [Betaproteobacteria bacterium]
MRRIEELFIVNVEDGKRYFLMEEEEGEIRTGIAKATVTSRGTGLKLSSGFSVNFTLVEGDLRMGVMEHVIYMAEID